MSVNSGIASRGTRLPNRKVRLVQVSGPAANAAAGETRHSVTTATPGSITGTARLPPSWGPQGFYPSFLARGDSLPSNLPGRVVWDLALAGSNFSWLQFPFSGHSHSCTCDLPVCRTLPSTEGMRLARLPPPPQGLTYRARTLCLLRTRETAVTRGGFRGVAARFGSCISCPPPYLWSGMPPRGVRSQRLFTQTQRAGRSYRGSVCRNSFLRSGFLSHLLRCVVPLPILGAR